MLFQHKPFAFQLLRTNFLMYTLMVLLLSAASLVAGGSIATSHKSATAHHPQQQQQKAQMMVHLSTQQQQPQMMLHQQQQQQPVHASQLLMPQKQLPQQLQQKQPQLTALHQMLNEQQQSSNNTPMPTTHVGHHQQQQQQQLQQDQNLLPSSQLATIPNHISSDPTSNDDDYTIVKDVDVNDEINDINEINDPYQYLSNDLRVEPRLTAGNSLPWNPYATTTTTTTTPNQQFAHLQAMLNNFPSYASTPFGSTTFGGTAPFPSSSMVTPRFIPLFSYPQPVFLPLPMYFAPANNDPFYPNYGGAGNDLDDDTMARAINDHRRAQSSAHSPPLSGMMSSSHTPRNSQIYFMRLAPMPYTMFMPGLGFTPQASLPPVVDTYSAVPAAISPIWNIPLSFVANGKPTNIYQIGGAPNDFSNSMHFNNVNPFGLRPPPSLSPAFSFAAAAQRPSSVASGGFSLPHGSSYGLSRPLQSQSQKYQQQQQQQDSKLTLLKRPFFFNGRPDEIYTLPNNFNPLYTNAAYY